MVPCLPGRSCSYHEPVFPPLRSALEVGRPDWCRDGLSLMRQLCVCRELPFIAVCELSQKSHLEAWPQKPRAPAVLQAGL